MTARVPALGVALILAIAACSTGRPSAAAPVATAVVDLPISYRFAPTDVTVAAGTTVTWSNHDRFTHSVQFVDGDLPTEPLVMEPDSATTFTFDRAGTFRYQCHLHPQNMKGSVTVTA
jgi:plastocyanin